MKPVKIYSSRKISSNFTNANTGTPKCWLVSTSVHLQSQLLDRFQKCNYEELHWGLWDFTGVSDGD